MKLVKIKQDNGFSIVDIDKAIAIDVETGLTPENPVTVRFQFESLQYEVSFDNLDDALYHLRIWEVVLCNGMKLHVEDVS
jgi:hypothetical protein